MQKVMVKNVGQDETRLHPELRGGGGNATGTCDLAVVFPAPRATLSSCSSTPS